MKINPDKIITTLFEPRSDGYSMFSTLIYKISMILSIFSFIELILSYYLIYHKEYGWGYSSAISSIMLNMACKLGYFVSAKIMGAEYAFALQNGKDIGF